MIMKLLKLHLDSSILNKRMFKLVDFEKDWIGYGSFEAKACEKYLPDYVQISINSLDTEIIHHFEGQGYRFSEFRINRKLNLQSNNISDSYLFPYSINQVANNNQLKTVLEIAKEVHFDDRFSSDYSMSEMTPIKRNLTFLKKSYQKKDEFLLFYSNQQSGKILGYQSGKFINEKEVLLFLTGLTVDFESKKYRGLFDLLFYKWLINNHVKHINAVSNGVNLTELNLAFQSQSYEIVSTEIVLRKWFSQIGYL